MIPHMQTDTGENTGNCFPACIASILEIPLDDVPNFIVEADKAGKDMYVLADDWLREHHRMRFISIQLYKRINVNTTQVIANPLSCINPDELVILSGKSPRSKKNKLRYHAVVGRPKFWGFDIVHDPHPSGQGIVGQPYGVKWIVKV